jgi:hypothetical protein
MSAHTIATFQQNLRGRLIQPSDTDYDAARALFDGMIDKRPRLIARCADVADAITAVNSPANRACCWRFVAAVTTAPAWAAAMTGW